MRVALANQYSATLNFDILIQLSFNTNKLIFWCAHFLLFLLLLLLVIPWCVDATATKHYSKSSNSAYQAHQTYRFGIEQRLGYRDNSF